MNRSVCRQSSLSFCVLGLLLCASSLLTGCGSSPAVVAAPVTGTGGGSTGSGSGLSFGVGVLAGTQAVSGASIQLYAAGTSGNGSTAVSLSTGATTNATGVVIIPAGYACPSAASMLYVVSRGGSVGGSTANSNLVLMSSVGACSSVTSAMTVIVDEATTVGAAVALAPFYSTGAMIGSSSTNASGLTNAFSTANELVSMTTGKAPGATLPANAEPPTTRVNSLANAVNRCAVTASACASFFSAATLPAGSAPTNTLDALVNVIRSPANNVAGVFAATQGTSTASSPVALAYGPALVVAPTDWTFFLTLSGGGLNGPSGLGVDSSGSVWVASYFGAATKFTPLGALSFANGVSGSGLNNSYGLAIDQMDNAWIPNEQPHTALGTGSVSEFSSAGSSLAGTTGYTAGGMNYPISVAIDPDTTAWVVDYGNSHLTLLNSSGMPTPASGTAGFTSSSFSFPVAVVVDGNHAGWVANQSNGTVLKVANDGKTFTPYNCCNGASGLAIDQSNNVWVANYYGSSVSLISSAGTVISNGAYTGASSIDQPQGIAVDGAGNVWVANYRAPYLSALTGTSSAVPGTSVTPATGFGADAKLLEAYALAIDASGSIWVSNFGSNTVTKFLGLAAPTKTPLSGTAKAP